MKTPAFLAVFALATAAARAAIPVAEAGPDHIAADFNADQSVTVVLDASASTDADDDIVSWQWSWPGGSASGETVEAVFPVTNSRFTITLTVTDALGGTDTDTLEAGFYSVQAGFYTDFKKPSYSGNDFALSPFGSRVVGTLRGGTLVIDPRGTGVPEIYQLNAGGWIASPFPTSVPDIRAVDATTLLSANIYSATGFTAHRWNGTAWVPAVQTLSATPPGRRIIENSYEPGVVASADSFDDTYFNNAGRAFVYDWTGDNWTHSELLPPEGFASGKRWGEGIDSDGTITAVTDGSGSTTVPNLKIFRKTGTWSHEASLAPPIEPGFGQSYFSGFVSVGNGVVIAQRESPKKLFVIEHIAGNWVQTPLPIAPEIPFGGFFGLRMDSDGQSFVANDQGGRFILYQKDPLAAQWSGVAVTRRVIPTGGMFGGGQLLCTDFSGGKIVLSDSVNGVVRVIDKDAPFDVVNAEPVANAGPDLTSTSFDGQPVLLFLNGALSSDAGSGETLTARWTWNGGSATGLQTFAMVSPEVTQITLTLTDSRGVVSRDSAAVAIKRPAVIDPGPDVAAVDSDGDGLVRLVLDPQVISQDFPIVSWNWHWPGGSFSGRTGTITLGPEADGGRVTVEAIDSNGLRSSTSFAFRLLDPNPAPVILQAADGASLDRYGWSTAIGNGEAAIGAPFKPAGGVTFATNIGADWFQYPQASPNRSGQAVLVGADFAFTGSGFISAPAPAQGAVTVYQKQGGLWTPVQDLAASDVEASGFGASLARDGNRLVIGAPRTGTFNAVTGAVYVFELSNGVWSETAKIISPDGPTIFGDDFGARVAVSGDHLAVASPGFATNSSVHVFRKDPGGWVLIHDFESDVPRTAQGRGPQDDGDFFGVGLAMDDNELLVGSPQDSLVFRYTRDGAVWTRNGEIDPGRYRFGKSLALRDGVLAASSTLDEEGRFTDPDFVYGSVTVFRKTGGGWLETVNLRTNKAIDPLIGDQNIERPEFGYSVAHDGRDLVVGLPGARNSSGTMTGKAYIYQNLAALDPDANREPLANAGADITVADTVNRGPAPEFLITEALGSEPVTLNASAASDAENALVSFLWSWPGGSATGATPTARFPVGTTTVTLTVTDAGGLVDTDTVNVTVTLARTAPAALPAAVGNTLTVNLPSPAAKWRLSSEFLWHGSGDAATGVVDGAVYQVEILPYPGSVDVVDTFVTIEGAATVVDLDIELPDAPATTGVLTFPETAQGFSWRLTGEDAWRVVTGNGDEVLDDVVFSLPTGTLRIEFKPVAGYATPQPRTVVISTESGAGLDWGDYLRIGGYDPAGAFELVPTPDLEADPHRFIGMIRTPLGRGTGTVVAERVVLTAGHLFFDATGLQWSDSSWYSRQQQGVRQAPPIEPRGVLYRTSYAKLIAPDSVEGSVEDLPEDAQEVDFAVLYFSSESTWDQGSANFLQSTAEKNWLTGSEMKRAAGYPQRSQPYENRGRIFTKSFSQALVPLDENSPPLLYESRQVFGDGGASGSALFVTPAGGGASYPAAILLAGQGRAVYRVIDADVTRMIKDGEDAASGNDDVLDSNSSLLTFDGLGALTTIAVNVQPLAVRSAARWTLKPKNGTGISNMRHTREVLYDESWGSITITFSAVSGYATPAPRTIFKSALNPDQKNTFNFTYAALAAPPPPPTPLQAWQTLHSISDLSLDTDRDGMSALLEYALDRNPNSPDYRSGIRPAANPVQQMFPEYDVYVSAAAAGITYRVRAANQPGGAGAVTLATFTHADGTSAYRRVTDTQAYTSSARRFAWLEITAP